MKKRAFFCSVKTYTILLVIILGACVTIPDYDKLNSHTYQTVSEYFDFDPNKIVYSSEIRGVKYIVYSPPEIRGVKYREEPLLTETGEKIHSADDAVKRISYYKDRGQGSVSEKIIFGSACIYLVPSSILKTSFETIIDLPALPFLFYAIGKTEKIITTNYENGKAEFRLKNYENARLHFFGAIDLGKKVIQDSDIYYWIAKTYEEEGNIEKANQYFQLFIKYSLRLYPEYFVKYDKNLLNDYEKLKTLFDEAEMKITTLK